MVLSYWSSGLKSVIYLPVNAILGLRLNQMIRMHRICDTVKHLVVSAIRCSGLQHITNQNRSYSFFSYFQKNSKTRFLPILLGNNGIPMFSCQWKFNS